MSDSANIQVMTSAAASGVPALNLLGLLLGLLLTGTPAPEAMFV